MATEYRELLKKYIGRVQEITGTDHMPYPDDEFSGEDVGVLQELSDEAYLETG